ncbi:MAG: hypothetical protein ACD_8C00132G0001, partial [uncultured bacterium]
MPRIWQGDECHWDICNLKFIMKILALL